MADTEEERAASHKRMLAIGGGIVLAGAVILGVWAIVDRSRAARRRRYRRYRRDRYRRQRKQGGNGGGVMGLEEENDDEFENRPIGDDEEQEFENRPIDDGDFLDDDEREGPSVPDHGDGPSVPDHGDGPSVPDHGGDAPHVPGHGGSRCMRACKFLCRKFSGGRGPSVRPIDGDDVVADPITGMPSADPIHGDDYAVDPVEGDPSVSPIGDGDAVCDMAAASSALMKGKGKKARAALMRKMRKLGKRVRDPLHTQAARTANRMSNLRSPGALSYMQQLQLTASPAPAHCPLKMPIVEAYQN